MKLEFRDELKRDAIDLSFDIKDNAERDITVEKADIQWSLTLQYSTWGIDSFHALTLLVVPILIDTVKEDGTLDSTKLYAEVKFNNKRGESIYFCRIYEDVFENDKWREEEYVTFPIELAVEEKPATERDNRSQIYVKYLELDISSDKKRLKLTI